MTAPTNEQIERAFKRFTECCNSMIMCPQCNGTGFHHGFGEDGHDPDWCENCGGCQSISEFDDRSAMREALTAAFEAGEMKAVTRNRDSRAAAALYKINDICKNGSRNTQAWLDVEEISSSILGR